VRRGLIRPGSTAPGGEATGFAPSFALAVRLERVEFTRVEAHDLLMVGPRCVGTSGGPRRTPQSTEVIRFLPVERFTTKVVNR
jgi:hypothetical protein